MPPRVRGVNVVGVVAAMALVVSAALVANVAGIVRYPGGPLREAGADGPLLLDTWPADWGYSAVGNQADASWARTGASRSPPDGARRR